MKTAYVASLIVFQVVFAAALAWPQSYGSVERLSPAVNQIVPVNARIERVATGFKWTEGPVWIHSGYLLFADIPHNNIRKWTPGRGVIGFYDGDNVNASLSRTETYSYDALNRLVTAVATAVPSGSSLYNFTYQYDPYGNMACVINGNTQGPCPQYSFSSNNQITNAGFSYDASGNLTAASTEDGNFTYGYDAEGRMVSAGGGRTASFTYDAFGRLVETSDTRYREEFLYGPAGEDLGDVDAQAGAWWDERIPFAGRRTLADNAGWYPPSGNATVFSHINQVESATAFTNYSGGLENERLYYPWGHYWTQIGPPMEEVYGGITDDQELYAALQRRQNPGLGRWMTPDPAGLAAIDLMNPQSWNAYAYAGNNPTTDTDPTGLYCTQDSNGNWIDVGTKGESCADVEASNAAEEKNPSTNVTGEPGNVAEAVVTNIGIGIGNLMTGNANTASTILTVGQYSPNFPHVPAGSGIAANIGAIAPLVGMAFIAPEGEGGAADEVFEDSEPALRRLAKKFGLNLSSPTTRQVLKNLDLTVDQFITRFRQARIRGELPSEFLNQSVRQALESGDTTVRKLLTKGEYAKW